MKEIVADLISALMKNDLFTEEEARLLIRSVQADTPEELPDALESFLHWAIDVKMKWAILDVILQFAPQDAIAVRWQDGGPALKLTCAPEEIEIRE